MNQTYLSVTNFNNQFKAYSEATFESVHIKGEISNLVIHTSGHIYFSLKDENSIIKCVMFKNWRGGLKFNPQNGQHILIDGKLNIYTPRGEYNILCFNISKEGIGDLTKRYEELKKKLALKGYFDLSIKKPLPKFVSHIAIVSASQGAGVADMLKIANKRFPLVKITLIDTLVQGESAKRDIANSIKTADNLNVDVIIVGRGGGSKEDLWAFNEEIVADSIFEAKTPIVSAVGHESDTLISDLVADIRASTPSNAIEIVLPDRDELLLYIDGVIEKFNMQFNRILHKKSEELNYLKKSFAQNRVEAQIEYFKREIIELKERFNKNLEFLISKKEALIPEVKNSLNQNLNMIIIKKESELKSLNEAFKFNHPSKKVLTNYAQIIKDNELISLENIKRGEEFELQDGKFKVGVKAIYKRKI